MQNTSDAIITLWAELEYVRRDWHDCLISDDEAEAKRQEILRKLKELGVII